jgi:hypothetical protein
VTGLAFCPQCGTPRQGSLRYCASCAFDFSTATSEGPAPGPPPPESPATQISPAAPPPTAPPPESPPAATSRSTQGSRRPLLLRVGAAIAALLVVGAIAVALQGNDPGVAKPGASDSQTASPSPRATPRATVRPTPRPTPEPAAVVEKTQEVVHAWQGEFSDYVSYQVVLEIKNTGTGWAELSGFGSDYTILGPDGGVITTGSFNYEFPKFVGPGEFGYLVADGSDIGGGGSTVADYATVEISGRFNPIGSPAVTFEVTDIALKAESFGGGLVATGFVTPSKDVTDAALAVICFGADGQVLGATWTNLLQNLTAGQRKGFETVGGTPPMSPSDCGTVGGFASDTGF